MSKVYPLDDPLRIEFAKAALIGLLSHGSTDGYHWINGTKLGTDRAAWAMADAVLNVMDDPSIVKKVKP